MLQEASARLQTSTEEPQALAILLEQQTQATRTLEKRLQAWQAEGEQWDEKLAQLRGLQEKVSSLERQCGDLSSINDNLQVTIDDKEVLLT